MNSIGISEGLRSWDDVGFFEFKSPALVCQLQKSQNPKGKKLQKLLFDQFKSKREIHSTRSHPSAWTKVKPSTKEFTAPSRKKGKSILIKPSQARYKYKKNVFLKMFISFESNLKKGTLQPIGLGKSTLQKVLLGVPLSGSLLFVIYLSLDASVQKIWLAI